MADKFKKIDKDFLLSDSSLNSYKYRLLTSGYLLAEYAKNPIGYFMHGTEEYPREQGVLVKWENLRVDGDGVWGKPCINLSHPRGQRTVDEVESGFLNAASFGQFVVLEISDKPEDYLNGQEGPSVSKWFNRECSLVDVPGNYNALTELFDKDNNPLKLEDLIAEQNFKNIKIMKQVFLTPEQIATMQLKSDADGQAVDIKLKELVAEAAKVPTLIQNLAAANSERDAAVNELKALKASTVEKEVNDIADGALAAKKITVALCAKLKTDYAGNPSGLKSLVAEMPAYTGIVKSIEGSKAAKNLADKTWEEMDTEGTLEDLKASDPELFKQKYKEAFKQEYTGQ